MEQSPFGFFEKSPRQKTTTENENPFVKFNESMKQRDAEKEREMKELAKKFHGENLQSQDENQNTQGYHDVQMMRSHAGTENQMMMQKTLEERAQLLRKKPTNINYNVYPEAHPYRNPYIPAKTLDGTYMQFPRDPFIKRVRAGRLAPARNVPQTGSRFSLRASSESQESESNTNSWQDEDNNPPRAETRPPPVADNVGQIQAKIAAELEAKIAAEAKRTAELQAKTAEIEAKMATVQLARRVPVNVKTIAEIEREKAAARRLASKGDKNNNPPFKSRTFGATSPAHAFGGFTFCHNNYNNTPATVDSSAHNRPSVLPQLPIVTEREVPPQVIHPPPTSTDAEAKPVNSYFALGFTAKNENVSEPPKDDRSLINELMDTGNRPQEPLQKPTGYDMDDDIEDSSKLFTGSPTRKKAFKDDDFEKRFEVGNGFESLPLVEEKKPSVVIKKEVDDGYESVPAVKKETPDVVNKNETPILLSASLRACVFCSAVKLRDVFFLDGCSTCEQFVSMKGDMEKVKECTTEKFVGFVNIPMNNEKCTMFAGKSPGFYAIIEEPSAEMIEKMRAQGVEYRPLAFFK